MNTNINYSYSNHDLNIKVISEENISIDTGVVVVFMNNQYNNTYDLTKNSTIILKNITLPKSENDILIYYLSISDKFHNSNLTSKLYELPRIYINPINTYIGDKVSLKANITFANKTIDYGYCLFKIDGKTIHDENLNDKIKVQNNLASLNYTIPNISAKTHNLTVIYTYNDTKIEISTEIKINKKNTIIKTSQITTTANKTQVIATIEDSNGNLITTPTNIHLKMNGKIINRYKTTNGKINITINTPPEKGTYNLQLIKSENSKTKTNKTNTTLTKKIPAMITITQNTINIEKEDILTINTKITDNLEEVNTGKVILIIGNNTVKTTSITNGYENLTYTIPTQYYGKYDIKIEYRDNSNKLLASNTTYINVTRKTAKLNSTITTTDNGTKVVTTVTDKNGYNTNEGYLTLYVNETYYGLSYVNNGRATINADGLKNGTYTYKITYTSSNYDTKTITKSYTYTQITYSMTMTSPTTATNGSNINITINVKRNNGTTVNNGYINIYLNQEYKTFKYITQGIATTTITLPNSIGTKNITVKYYTDDGIEKSKITKTIKIQSPPSNKKNTTIEINYNGEIIAEPYETITIYTNTYETGYSYYDESKLVSKGKVEYYINNTYIGSSSVNNGYSEISYTPYNYGLYIVTAKYSDSSNTYNSNSSQIGLNVGYNYDYYLTPYIMAPDYISFIHASTGDLTSGRVVFRLNGTYLTTAYIDESSYVEAYIKTPKTEGMYLLTATFYNGNGNEVYTQKKYIPVRKYSPDIFYEGIYDSDKYNYFEINLWSMIGDDSAYRQFDGTVTVTFNGESKTVNMSDEDGTGLYIPFKFPTKAGDYKITITYNGSEHFSKVTTYDTVTITQWMINNKSTGTTKEENYWGEALS